MWEEIRDSLRQISSMSSIRSAEFLLATIKVALGAEIILSVVGPHPRTTFSWAAGLLIGIAFLLIAFAQMWGVLRSNLRLRQIAVLAGTFMWIYFVGLAWVLMGSPISVLVYVPLILFNVMAFTRLAKLDRVSFRAQRETSRTRERARIRARTIKINDEEENDGTE